MHREQLVVHLYIDELHPRFASSACMINARLDAGLAPLRSGGSAFGMRIAIARSTVKEELTVNCLNLVEADGTSDRGCRTARQRYSKRDRPFTGRGISTVHGRGHSWRP